MKSKFFRITAAGLFLVLGFCAHPAHAQTAARLEALLKTTEITWEQAASFVLEAADVKPAGSSAFSYAADQKWLPKGAVAADKARLKGVALLLMRSFNLKGGLFFKMSKSPHHAYRELNYKRIIRGDTDPDMTVSGPDLLLMINRILSIKEKNNA